MVLSNALIVSVWFVIWIKIVEINVVARAAKVTRTHGCWTTGKPGNLFNYHAKKIRGIDDLRTVQYVIYIITVYNCVLTIIIIWLHFVCNDDTTADMNSNVGKSETI